MLASLYPLIAICVLLFATIWYSLKLKEKTNKFVKMAFWLSVLLYFPCFLLYYNFEFITLLWLIRDIGIFIGYIYLYHLLRRYKKLQYITLVLAILAVIALWGVNRDNPADSVTQSYGELLFDIKTHEQLNLIEEALAQYNPKFEKAFPHVKNEEITELDDYYLLDIPDEYSGELEKIMNILYETKAIDWVEVNEEYKLDPVETKLQDAGVTEGSFDYINDPFADRLWGFNKMKIKELHELLKNKNLKKNKVAKVFILDTGVDAKHEDIEDNFFSIADKFNDDKQGHGTHCAGIASAVSNNGKGIASFTPGNDFMKVTSIKVLGDDGRGTQEGIIDGIILAADNGADVISMSLGGRATDRTERAYNAAIEYANKAGAIIVVAAGNNNGNARNHTPACCKGVITISAVDETMNKASFSNYVTDLEMKLAAPGVNIYSTFPNNEYRSLNGTSMATPYVAGLLGLMKSLNEKLTTKEAYEILETTGIETGNTTLTGKFIQPEQVVKAMTK